MRKVIIVLAIAMSPVYATEPKASDVEVFVVIGANAIPLGVEHHFPNVAGSLPVPGTLPVTDPHDRGHKAKTYCYRFVVNDYYEFLEIYDSDFGMHSAQMSRVSASVGAECAVISAQPKFKVNGTLFSLSATELPRLPGFQEEKKNGSLVLKREWTYSNPSRSHQWGNCYSRYVSIETKAAKHGFSSIAIMNWDEPGC